MDGRERAHTGAQNDEGGKIRGLLARGQEQSEGYRGHPATGFAGCRVAAVSYQLKLW
jgi:hypothetical protein